MILHCCVFCASSPDVESHYLELAHRTGRLVAEHHARLVFGGSRCGCMESLAVGALEVGGRVIGILPDFRVETDWHDYPTLELEHVQSLHQRKSRMEELADVFIILPGGLGTLDELHEVLALRLLGYLDRPVYLINDRGFFDPLLSFYDQLRGLGFCRVDYRSLVEVKDRPEEVFSDLMMRGALTRGVR
ncbi:MAG: TIGR00730 family Rossman fold protein [Phycisphaeraceae bacterium]|nr:TIGR00730 family Rossman fold protein [Phycisphaeraceae bacterium]